MKSILKISLDDIQYNWKLINTASNGKAAAVVKANAYGMGMIEVTRALLESGCNYFYVANIFEGLKLRKNFNSNEISIAIFEGYLEGNQKIYSENNLTPVLNNLEQLKRLNNSSTAITEQKAIINIDTGMSKGESRSKAVPDMLEGSSPNRLSPTTLKEYYCVMKSNEC